MRRMCSPWHSSLFQHSVSQRLTALQTKKGDSERFPVLVPTRQGWVGPSMAREALSCERETLATSTNPLPLLIEPPQLWHPAFPAPRLKVISPRHPFERLGPLGSSTPSEAPPHPHPCRSIRHQPRVSPTADAQRHPPGALSRQPSLPRRLPQARPPSAGGLLQRHQVHLPRKHPPPPSQQKLQRAAPHLHERQDQIPAQASKHPDHPHHWSRSQRNRATTLVFGGPPSTLAALKPPSPSASSAKPRNRAMNHDPPENALQLHFSTAPPRTTAFLHQDLGH
mmetsp:Transcript_7521/g.20578  ORF Transcript_7521/g.20578 Transcript_7521/m.20578 type:complete len:281 (+) Transcript_7521:1298-2140(+)